jgi:catechol 2,3-dioxygenase-like lactoylglutathione lyase family enzyme
MKRFWIVFSAVACAFLGSAVAQPPAPDAGIVGIAHIAFRVSDLDREIAFLGKLGYEESFAITGGGKTLEVFVKVNDRQFIELYPQTDPAQPLGWMHVCFEAGDLDALVKYYISIGLKAPPSHKAGAGNLISAMNDPEGRVTEFTQYMPGSRHTLDRGQHLGVNRVSTELLGFDLPVNALAAEKQFYIQLGFEAQDAGGNVHLTTPGAPDVRLELRPAHPGALPEFLFPVSDARRAAEQLKAAGVRPERSGKLVFVHDPDGNLFIFLEI